LSNHDCVLAVIVGTIVLALFTPLISIITGLQQKLNSFAEMTKSE